MPFRFRSEVFQAAQPPLRIPRLQIRVERKVGRRRDLAGDEPRTIENQETSDLQKPLSTLQQAKRRLARKTS